MKLRVCVAGVTGWVGAPLSKAISNATDLALVGAVSRTHKGRSLKETIPEIHLDLEIKGSVEEALEIATDVLVDYTSARAVKGNVLTAISQGVHCIIGSSGLTNADFFEIEQAALKNSVGVIAAGNFAITAVLLQRFATEAAKFLNHWEVIDYAADTKEDAPSGTARELAFRLSEVRQPERTIPIESTLGDPISRGATLGGTQIHSIRLPGFVIAVEAIFGAQDERLIIRHEAGSGAEPYIEGTLLAIKKVASRVGLTRGLDGILDSL